MSKGKEKVESAFPLEQTRRPADRTLTLSLDIIQLLKHARDIDDQPAPNKRHTLRVDQPTRQRVEGVTSLLSRGFVPDDDGMPSIVPTGRTTAEVGLGSEDIGEFAFSFVTPLGTEAVSVEESITSGV